MKGGSNGNAFTNAAAGMKTAGDTAAAGTGFTANTPTHSSLFGQFNNPYTQNVIDGAVGDMSKARDMSLNDAGAAATAAGAFGGSRHGLVEGQIHSDFANNVGNLSANLRNQGFDTAMGLADRAVDRSLSTQFGQHDRRMGAAGGLFDMANGAYGVGRDIQGQMARDGAQQQSLIQGLFDRVAGEFGNYAGSPAASISLPAAAIGASPQPSTTNTSASPGLFNYLSMGLGLL